MGVTIKIKADELQSTVKGLIEKYADDIRDGMDEAAKKCATQCVKLLQETIQRLFKNHNPAKPYAKNWTKSQTETARGKAAYTVYCRLPGLTHLLEYGHAKTGGGRVAGRSHIALVEKQIEEGFRKAVEEAIQDAD